MSSAIVKYGRESARLVKEFIDLAHDNDIAKDFFTEELANCKETHREVLQLLLEEALKKSKESWRSEKSSGKTDRKRSRNNKKDTKETEKTESESTESTEQVESAIEQTNEQETSPKKTKKERVIELAKVGYSKQQIKTLVGCDESTIRKTLNKHPELKEKVEAA